MASLKVSLYLTAEVQPMFALHEYNLLTGRRVKFGSFEPLDETCICRSLNPGQKYLIVFRAHPGQSTLGIK
jgi:hypothetical protein